MVDQQGGLIAGHGRVLAAKKLGFEEIPVMVAAGWSEAQKRAYVIADNKLTLNGGWDDELLKVELDDLKALDFDLALMGFSLDEIGALAGEAPGRDRDAGGRRLQGAIRRNRSLLERDGPGRDLRAPQGRRPDVARDHKALSLPIGIRAPLRDAAKAFDHMRRHAPGRALLIP